MKKLIAVYILLFSVVFSWKATASNTLVNKTNLAPGTYKYQILIEGCSNAVIQYNLISSDADNTLTVTFWATVYDTAVKENEIDWVDVTTFLTGSAELVINNSADNDFSIIDSQIPFNKIKVKIVVTNSTPNNAVKIGFKLGQTDLILRQIDLNVSQ